MDSSRFKRSSVFKIFALLVMAVAIPLTVGLSLTQQETRTRAAVGVFCDNGVSCTPCISTTSNSCYANGRMNCAYTKKVGGGECDIQQFNNIICQVNNCNSGATCQNKACVPTQ